MLLFTVTDFEHPNTPVIEDTINEAKEQIENVKKNLHEGHLLVRKRNGEEKLRVDQKYLISLGLPVYPDDVYLDIRVKLLRIDPKISIFVIPLIVGLGIINLYYILFLRKKTKKINFTQIKKKVMIKSHLK